MQLYGRKDRWVFKLATLCSVLFTLSGCAVMGPSSISHGRADYNEAINRTEDEQLLMAMVKSRYGETTSLLAVNGVAANVRFKTNAGVNVGWGPQGNYDGNLVPFSAGLAYEENPTITYAPVIGETYFRQLMSPISLDLLLLSMRAETDVAEVVILLVSKVNNLRNPDFHEGPLTEPDPRFIRFVELTTELIRAGVMDLVADPRKEVPFAVVIDDYAHQYSREVVEFLDLLDLSVPGEQSEEIVIPAYFGINTRKVWGIGITTRSTFDLIEIFKAAIEVPQEHAGAGLTVKFPPCGLAGQGIRVISSKERPKEIPWAVKYRGYWFYIDETDLHTKSFFVSVRKYWSFTIAAASDQSAAPVLTLPVSR